MAQRNKGKTRGFSTTSRKFDSYLRKAVSRAKLLKESRIVLIRDGAHGDTETKEILLQKTHGQHDRALTKSLKVSKVNAMWIEAFYNEIAIDMEADLHALPEAARPRIQAAIQKILKPTTKLPKPKQNARLSRSSRKAREAYANRERKNIYGEVVK